MSDFELKVWRLHPQGCRVVRANKTLDGHANEAGVKWCGPFTNANKFGFWVFPPMDIDMVWKGDGVFEHKVVNKWETDEIPFIRAMTKPEDDERYKTWSNNFGGRLKVDFGRVEPNICQMWTGCIFQTPPGWALMIRSPINIGMDAPYRIQEGILETDWLQYDIWINIAVQRKNEPISLRRDQQTPLAQLIPVRKEGYDEKWTVSEQMVNRETEEGDKLYTGWCDYNWKKYLRMIDQKPKDSGTYWKERARHLGKRTNEQDVVKPPTPKPTQSKPARLPKATPKRLLPARKDEN